MLYRLKHLTRPAVLCGLSLAGLAAAPAHATVASPNSATVTAVGSAVAGVDYGRYVVTNSANSTSGLTELEIPEINLGDIVFGTTPATALPSGWTATQVTTQHVTGSGLYSGTAAGFIDLFDTGNALMPGSSVTFTAIVPTLNWTNASLGAMFSNGTTIAIDPPIPNTVPEPASMPLMIVGLLGLAALVRRR